jgi:hypothetical protein
MNLTGVGPRAERARPKSECGHFFEGCAALPKCLQIDRSDGRPLFDARDRHVIADEHEPIERCERQGPEKQCSDDAGRRRGSRQPDGESRDEYERHTRPARQPANRSPDVE